MKDFREAIPGDTKCALCGKKKWHHKAVTFHCTIGRPGRANTHQFSVTQRFEPVMPKLPVAVKGLLYILENNAQSKGFAEAIGDPHHKESADESYIAARYALQAHLNSIFYPTTKVKL
jgi:hypothetical protein